MKQHTQTQKRSTAPGNANSAGAAENAQSRNRTHSDSQLLLTNPEQSTTIAVTANGRKNLGNFPLFAGFSLLENLTMCFLTLKKDGQYVASINRKRNKATGQLCLCLHLAISSADAMSTKEFLALASELSS